MKTTCFTNLSFLNAIDEGNPDLLKPEVQKYLTQQLGRPVSALFSLLGDTKTGSKHFSMRKASNSMRGAMRLSRSNSTHTGNEISLDKLRFSRHQSQVDPISSSSVRSRHSSGFSGNESADDDDDLILGMFTSSEEREK